MGGFVGIWPEDATLENITVKEKIKCCRQSTVYLDIFGEYFREHLIIRAYYLNTV